MELAFWLLGAYLMERDEDWIRGRRKHFDMTDYWESPKPESTSGAGRRTEHAGGLSQRRDLTDLELIAEGYA